MGIVIKKLCTTSMYHISYGENIVVKVFRCMIQSWCFSLDPFRVIESSLH